MRERESETNHGGGGMNLGRKNTSISHITLLSPACFALEVSAINKFNLSFFFFKLYGDYV